MPIRSLQLSASLKSKLNRKISWLLSKEILQLPGRKNESFAVGFCMHIQIVPRRQFDSLNFGKSEGIRAFIQSGTQVIAAADFFYSGAKQMKLSYIHQGAGLKDLLVMMNKLEKIYQRQTKNCFAELIYFLLAPSPYLMIKCGREKQFFVLKNERLTRSTAKGLRKNINEILINR